MWQELDAGNITATVPYALGFHFFSHFLWLWLIPLCSYLVETGKIRKRVIAGFTMFGAFAGTLVYATMLFQPEWMTVAVKEHSIIYNFVVPDPNPIPFLNTIHIPVTPAMLYGLTILVPLFFSSLQQIRIFGVLVAMSIALASVAYNEAFVSVWCFFAAVLSLYLVYMICGFVAASGEIKGQSTTTGFERG